MKNEDLLKTIAWALGDDTGRSSESLARHMLGIDHSSNGCSSPSDSDDRGRCIRLLNLIPEWWSRLDEMAQYPSSKILFYRNGHPGVREEGWKEQIVLIRKEGGK